MLANDTGNALSVYSVDGSTADVSHSLNTGHGTLTLNADGSFTYVPNANFVGTDDATFYVATDGVQQSNSATIQFVVAPGVLTATGTNVTATALTDTGSIPLATFTDTAGGQISEYTATINWGDGATTGGTIASNGTGGWIVDGNHTYATSGSYSVAVAISSNVGGSANASSAATVSPVNGGLSINSAEDQPVEPGAAFNTKLGNVSDSWSGANLSAITATVNWGDGSATQAATLTMTAGSGSNPATGGIYGGHTYASAGTYPITITVNDGAGHTVYFFPQRGRGDPAICRSRPARPDGDPDVRQGRHQCRLRQLSWESSMSAPPTAVLAASPPAKAAILPPPSTAPAACSCSATIPPAAHRHPQCPGRPDAQLLSGPE